MNPTNPTQIFDPENKRDKFGLWGLNPIQNQVLIEVIWVDYIFGLNSNLNPFWGQPEPIQSAF